MGRAGGDPVGVQPVRLGSRTERPSSKTDNLEEAKRYEFLWRSKTCSMRLSGSSLPRTATRLGASSLADLARWLGPERCKFIEYPDGAKDLNDVLLSYGQDGVRAVIDNAKPYPVKGLYKLRTFPIRPRRRRSRSASTGWTIFSTDARHVQVISGWAGHGKTSLLMRMLANLMERGVNIALGSFETMPRPILERRMRACLYRCGEFGTESEHARPCR
jgi:twinkle protein